MRRFAVAGVVFSGVSDRRRRAGRGGSGRRGDGARTAAGVHLGAGRGAGAAARSRPRDLARGPPARPATARDLWRVALGEYEGSVAFYSRAIQRVVIADRVNERRSTPLYSRSSSSLGCWRAKYLASSPTTTSSTAGIAPISHARPVSGRVFRRPLSAPPARSSVPARVRRSRPGSRCCCRTSRGAKSWFLVAALERRHHQHHENATRPIASERGAVELVLARLDHQQDGNRHVEPRQADPAIPRDMIESDLGRGFRSISRGSLSNPSAMPTGAVMTKLIHRICVAENGWPAAITSRLASRNVPRIRPAPRA